MSRLVVLLACVGCGRVGFGTSQLATDDAAMDGPPGHDEDGDGIADLDDTCPHLPGPQDDGDGDGVGDLCDPNPTTPGDTIARFATMGPGDQPFATGGGDASAVFTQLPDALRFDGVIGDDGNLYGTLALPITLGNVRVALGVDIVALVPGSRSGQQQIALAVWDQAPNYFVELNQNSTFTRAAITRYDGTNFDQVAFDELATGIHPGPVTLQTTQRVGERVVFETGWPGEPYDAEVVDALYQGAARIELSLNNLHLEFRYLIVITSP